MVSSHCRSFMMYNFQIFKSSARRCHCHQALVWEPSCWGCPDAPTAWGCFRLVPTLSHASFPASHGFWPIISEFFPSVTFTCQIDESLKQTTESVQLRFDLIKQMLSERRLTLFSFHTISLTPYIFRDFWRLTFWVLFITTLFVSLANVEEAKLWSNGAF